MHFSQLGYDSYDEYIDSPEWREIRDMYYSSGVAYRCRVCHSRKSLRLHKRTYYDLTPKFFYYLLKNNKRLFNKILEYLCSRCNTLIHFYDGRKQKKKVPLDYLFLWDREQRIYWRVDMVIRRSIRSFFRFFVWMYYSYTLRQNKRRNY
jgi:hypothetical protein